MKIRSLRYAASGTALLALWIGTYFYVGHQRDISMHAIPFGFQRFQVTDPVPVCAYWKDHMPKLRDPEVFRLYIDARKRWRSKIEWQFTKEELRGIFTDVKLAADRGDWGARALLAHFFLTGLGPTPANKFLDINQDKAVALARIAVSAGQPWGYYDIGVAHEHGYGGAVLDIDIAWAYYLRAAQLGSPDAQMALAEAYGAAERYDAREHLIKCAYAQGHGPAAYILAIRADINGLNREALRLYHDGVKFGSAQCAASLFLAFGDEHGGGPRTAKFAPLDLATDITRSQRYLEIKHALAINPDMKLGRLDEVLPLPPAKLPAWRGIEDAMTPEPSGPPSY